MKNSQGNYITKLAGLLLLITSMIPYAYASTTSCHHSIHNTRKHITSITIDVPQANLSTKKIERVAIKNQRSQLFFIKLNGFAENSSFKTTKGTTVRNKNIQATHALGNQPYALFAFKEYYPATDLFVFTKRLKTIYIPGDQVLERVKMPLLNNNKKSIEIDFDIHGEYFKADDTLKFYLGSSEAPIYTFSWRTSENSVLFSRMDTNPLFRQNGLSQLGFNWFIKENPEIKHHHISLVGSNFNIFAQSFLDQVNVKRNRRLPLEDQFTAVVYDFSLKSEIEIKKDHASRLLKYKKALIDAIKETPAYRVRLNSGFSKISKIKIDFNIDDETDEPSPYLTFVLQ